MVKKKTTPSAERRKAERRKPGDLRFPGRLVGVKKGARRQKDRRSGERRKK